MFHAGTWSWEKQSATVSSQTSPASPQTLLNTIGFYLWNFLVIYFYALNLIFHRTLATSCACSFTTVSDIWRFLSLTFTNHSQTIHCCSFPVLLSWGLVEPLLLFSHWCLIWDLAFFCLFYILQSLFLCVLFPLEALATIKWKRKTLWIFFHKGLAALANSISHTW
jgi:hypothetical protein